MGSTEEQNPPSVFKPNEEILQSLLVLGASRKSAEKALFATGNHSAELAAAWMFENSFDNDSDSESEFGDDENVRMIFVVNKELEMGKGKIAAQVGHAAIGLYEALCINEKQVKFLNSWKTYGECKIVLRGEDTMHLMTLRENAVKENIPNYLVSDAGKTQIPEGSVTVLALFGPQIIVDKITGTLKLL